MEAYAVIYDFDLIFITETWFHVGLSDGETQLKNYQCYREDRQDKKGGGVAIYVNERLQGLKIKTIGQYREALWYKIEMRNDHILAGVVYRPPSCNAEDDQVLTDTLMDAAQNKRIMIVGDFNFPDIDWIHMTAEKTSSQRFLQQTQDSLWFQHIIDPTRGDNILDLLLTSESEMVEDIQVAEQFGDSDHNCITWNCIITRGLGQRSKFELYDWKKANWEIMINDYRTVTGMSYLEIKLWRKCGKYG